MRTLLLTLLGCTVITGAAVAHTAHAFMRHAFVVDFDIHEDNDLVTSNAGGLLSGDVFNANGGIGLQFRVRSRDPVFPENAVCIKKWTWNNEQGNVLIGASGPSSAPKCDATKPIILWLNAGASYVGFYIVSKTGSKWNVTAKYANGQALPTKQVTLGNINNYGMVYVLDPLVDQAQMSPGKITRVEIAPAPGSDPTTEFGIDNLVFTY